MGDGQIALVDGQLLPADAATLPVTDEGVLRGDAVFEVIRVYGGVPFALREHLDRMSRSAANLRLELDAGQVEADLRTVLAARGGDGLLRAIVTRGGHRLVLTEPLRDAAAPVTLQTIAYSPPRVLDQVKSVSYAANMLATRLAREQDADDALLVTPHGRVLEGPTFSVFLRIGDGPFLTPPLTDQVLDSITRRIVLSLGLGAREGAITRDDLDEVSEGVAVSTTREVQPIGMIDRRPLPTVGGEWARAALAAFRTRVQAETGAS